MIDLGQKFLLMSAIYEQTFHLRQGLKLVAFKGKSVRGSPILYEQGQKEISIADDYPFYSPHF